MNHQGRIFLLYGQTLPREFITSSLVWMLLRPSILYFVDGANAFDGYGLIRHIVRQGHNPRVILKRIHISRTFTCYQLMERISSLTPFLSPNERGEGGVRQHALYVLGLLDTFYDEQVPLPEASRLLDQALLHLLRLARRGCLIIIATSLPPVKEAAARIILVQRLKAYANVIYRLEATAQNITLRVEK